jgi:hypothetical protein
MALLRMLVPVCAGERSFSPVGACSGWCIGVVVRSFVCSLVRSCVRSVTSARST